MAKESMAIMDIIPVPKKKKSEKKLPMVQSPKESGRKVPVSRSSRSGLEFPVGRYRSSTKPLSLKSISISNDEFRFETPDRSISNSEFRIHRKLKEVAVFRYTKKVDKDDGSVSILFSLANRFALNVQQFTISAHNAVNNRLNPGEE